MGRTATSRSRGAIEGTEGPAFVSSLCASTPRVPDRPLAPVALAVPLVSAVTFTAIAGPRCRGHRCSSPRLVVTTYAAINSRPHRRPASAVGGTMVAIRHRAELVRGPSLRPVPGHDHRGRVRPLSRQRSTLRLQRRGLSQQLPGRPGGNPEWTALPAAG